MERERQIYKVTLIGGAVNAALVAFKFVAGILGKSSAMIADAVHSLSDFITDIIVLVFVKISAMPQDESHDYGHGKYETLASTMIGLALLAVAGAIIYGGVVKVISWFKGEDLAAPGWIAFWAAIISIVAKELVYIYTRREGRKLNSSAVIANAEHHRSDALSSIGTAVGIGGAVILGHRWTILDPLASIIVGFFIVKVSVDLIREAIGELMERSLPDDIENEIIAIVSEFPEITEPHHLRTRRIGGAYAIEMHIRMDGNMSLFSAHTIATALEKRLKDHFGEKTHVGIHMEPIK